MGIMYKPSTIEEFDPTINALQHVPLIHATPYKHNMTIPIMLAAIKLYI
jgi:hypothetical protein